MILGSILDHRRYSTDNNADIQDEEQFIPLHNQEDYIEARDLAFEFRTWLFEKIQLSLVGTATATDGMGVSTRLRKISERWLNKQCRCLVIHKVEAEQLNYKRVHPMITAEGIKSALEEELGDYPEFANTWPRRSNGTAKDWAETWKNHGKSYSYAFPLPPTGAKYVPKFI